MRARETAFADPVSDDKYFPLLQALACDKQLRNNKRILQLKPCYRSLRVSLRVSMRSNRINSSFGRLVVFEEKMAWSLIKQ